MNFPPQDSPPSPANSPPKFSSGQVVITPGALEVLTAAEIATALDRHLHGDWGDCEPEDAEENELSLREGLRLLSVYHTAAQVKFWVITEADRSATTILLPAEYWQAWNLIPSHCSLFPIFNPLSGANALRLRPENLCVIR